MSSRLVTEEEERAYFSIGAPSCSARPPEQGSSAALQDMVEQEPSGDAVPDMGTDLREEREQNGAL
jgi:hypothetical protein